MCVEEEPAVWVRRQWNDWKRARVRLSDLQGPHWDATSGGINARAPRPFIHGYIWCNQLLEGELAHSCAHGAGPHRVKVCVVKKDNIPSVVQPLIVAADREREARVQRARRLRSTVAEQWAAGLAEGEREGPV
jgi:hypothetical protein